MEKPYFNKCYISYCKYTSCLTRKETNLSATFFKTFQDQVPTFDFLIQEILDICVTCASRLSIDHLKGQHIAVFVRKMFCNPFSTVLITHVLLWTTQSN